MNWWWLSFCDDARPKGSKFLGAAIVGPAAHALNAVRIAHALDCNPGGQVAAAEISDVLLERVPPRYRERLLDKDECAEVDRLMGAG